MRLLILNINSIQIVKGMYLLITMRSCINTNEQQG